MTLFYWKKQGCAPCTEMLPQVMAIAAEAEVSLRVCDAEDPGEAGAFPHHRVRSVPTLVLADACGYRLAGWTGAFITRDVVLDRVRYLAERGTA